MVVRFMSEWAGGGFLGQVDDVCLSIATTQGLTLVTYDCRTIPPLLKEWGEAGRDHSGVILVDDHTIPQPDIGTLGEALRSLSVEADHWDWTNRVIFLKRPRS